MALIKKYNNKTETIAEKSLIDHNQLANRNQYGAHSIDSIRGLPERIAKLKNKDKELEEKIDKHSSDVDKRIDEVEEKAKQINIVENDDSTFTFTNYGEVESKTIQSGFQPDNDTITLTDDKKMTLKRVYISNGLSGSGTKEDNIKINVDDSNIEIKDNKISLKEISHSTEFSGKGTSDDKLKLNIDNNTIINENGTLKASALKVDDNTIISGSEINNNLNAINSNIANIKEKDNQQDDKLYDLEARTKGMGGYLNSYDFGDFSKSTPELIQEVLTGYALQQIGVTDKKDIFNGTKVINEYDKHLWILTNTPDTDPAIFEWEDLGAVQNISVATNKLLGLVKGSTDDLKGSVDLNGEISVNNLESKLNDKASLTEENTFTGKQNFNGEQEINGVTEINKEVNVNDTTINFTNKNKDIVTKQSATGVIINDKEIKYPNKAGTFALQEDIDLSNYYTKEQINNLLPIEEDLTKED